MALIWLGAAAALLVVGIGAGAVLVTRHSGSGSAEAASPAQFASLQIGMTPTAVKGVLGKTSRKCWDYGQSVSGDEICFDKGKVVSTRPGTASTKLKVVSTGMREAAILTQIGMPLRKCWLYGPSISPDRLCFMNGKLASKSRG